MYHMDTRNSNQASKDSEGPAEFESRGHEDTIGCPLETDLGMRHVPFKPCAEAGAGKKNPCVTFLAVLPLTPEHLLPLLL